MRGTLFNGLSTFNSLDEETLPQEMGSIQKLLFTSKTESVGNVMLAIGASETSSVYVGESQLNTAETQPWLLYKVVSLVALGTTRFLRDNTSEECGSEQ